MDMGVAYYNRSNNIMLISRIIVVALMVLFIGCRSESAATAEGLDLNQSLISEADQDANQTRLKSMQAAFQSQMTAVRKQYPLIADYMTLQRFALAETMSRSGDQQIELNPELSTLLCNMYSLTEIQVYNLGCSLIIKSKLCGKPSDYLKVKQNLDGTYTEGRDMEGAINAWIDCIH